MSAQPDFERMLADENARAHPKRLPPLDAMAREFKAIGDDRYRLTIPDVAVTLEIDRLRREHHELIGELSARCELPGARTFDGTLSIADLNLSSARARTDRAKLLATRANTKDFDWVGLVEEFAQRVLAADRHGEPAIDLRTIPASSKDDEIEALPGFTLFRRHPTILFGDGGSAKSYLGLYVAGLLAEQGIRVGLFDWELAGEDHRDRLERLFPDGMPRVLYARCERSLVHEADRLRRIVRENDIQFCLYDSVVLPAMGRQSQPRCPVGISGPSARSAVVHSTLPM